MAWQSSGGYPGVVSDGAGGIVAAGKIVGAPVQSGPGGSVRVVTSGGSPVGTLTSATGHGQLHLTGGVAFFGHSIPAVPTTGGAATAGGTYTSTEQAMLEAVYTALQSIGLVT